MLMSTSIRSTSLQAR